MSLTLHVAFDIALPRIKLIMLLLQVSLTEPMKGICSLLHLHWASCFFFVCFKLNEAPWVRTLSAQSKIKSYYMNNIHLTPTGNQYQYSGVDLTRIWM